MKRRTPQPAALIAACAAIMLVAAACLIPLGASAAGQRTAAAAETENVGNPFENGDLTWDGNTQAYRISGLSIKVGDIYESGRPGSAGPFPYPACLQSAYQLFLRGEGGGNWPGWGVSTFSYGYVSVTGNSRGIALPALPDWGWCGQATNDTTVPWERDARLILVEENSSWSADGGIYHGCFALVVDNGHGYGYYDQATIGGEYAYIDWKVNGKAQIAKANANPALTDGNACYRLDGARYAVYASRQDALDGTGAVAELETGEDGRSELVELAPGTYFVRETQAPEGYALDGNVHELAVEAGQTAVLETEDWPQGNPVEVAARKIDGETGASEPQGAASLAGVRFEVRCYDGYYDSPEEAEASGEPTRTWVLETGEDGAARLDDASVVEGDELCRDSAGRAVLPLGTVVVQEVQAPEGYLLPDPSPASLHLVTPQGNGESVECFNAPTVPDEPVRGGVAVEKNDAETGLNEPQGAASVDGAVFAVVNRSEHPVSIGGELVAPGETVTEISTVDGRAETAADLLPYGTYSLEEITAPPGYLGSDAPLPFSITSDGQMAELFGDEAFENFVKRGDVSFSKKDAATGTALANVPFRITSETTGESHIVVTDENGCANTASAWNPHTRNTNANDDASEGTFDASAGIWFTGAQEEGAAVDDERGALPFDRYTVEELPCAANEGRQLVVQEGIAVTRDGTVIDLGTIDDPSANAATQARDAADGDRTVTAGTDAAAVDRVFYSGLVPGREYTARGTLVDAATGKPLDWGAGPICGEAVFTPEATGGVVEVSFDLSSSALLLPASGWERIDAAVFEEISCNGRVVAAHADADDAEQRLAIVAPEQDEQVEPPAESAPQGGSFGKTGFDAAPIAGALAATAVLGAATAGAAMLRRRGGKRWHGGTRK